MSERICTIEGCGKRHEARGYCAAHYQRWRQHGDPLGSKIREYPKRPRCTIDECVKPNYGHGYCEMHYWRWKRHGDPLAERQHALTHPRSCVHCTSEYQPKRAKQRFCSRRCASLFRQSDEYKQLASQDQKRCTKCNEIKRRDQFYSTSKGADGLAPWCKACRAIMSAEINARPEMKLRRRDRELQAKYGISLADYERMLEGQNYQCRICGFFHGDEGRQLVVDHCHSTGAVRGLLCTLCNSAIGYFEDDTERMARAISYLRGQS